MKKPSNMAYDNIFVVLMFCLMLLFSAIKIGTSSHCPEIRKFVKLESEFISWACAVITLPINTDSVADSSTEDVQTYVRRECTKSCMNAEECYILEVSESLECNQCRAENMFLWSSEMIDYNTVFGNSSKSYVKLDSQGSVQLGHGKCVLQGEHTSNITGDEFHVSPYSIKAERVTQLKVYSISDVTIGRFSFGHRIALEIAYDGIFVDDVTTTTSFNYDSVSTVMVESGQRIDKVLLFTSEGLPVDVMVSTTDGTNWTDHGPFFEGNYTTNVAYLYSGYNLRSMYGFAGAFLEQVDFTFDDC